MVGTFSAETTNDSSVTVLLTFNLIFNCFAYLPDKVYKNNKINVVFYFIIEAKIRITVYFIVAARTCSIWSMYVFLQQLNSHCI